LNLFKEGKLRALVSAQVLNEGLDVPDAEVGIVVAGSKGEREHVQRVGRVLRPRRANGPWYTSWWCVPPGKSSKPAGGGTPLLPEAAIPARLDRGRILPSFLDERDQPWLHVLIDEVDRFRGRPLRELQQRLREPLPCATPHFKLRAATQLLLRLGNSEIKSEVSPAEGREALFVQAAAQTGKPRTTILAAAASTLGLAPAALERALFADLPASASSPDPTVPYHHTRSLCGSISSLPAACSFTPAGCASAPRARSAR